MGFLEKPELKIPVLMAAGKAVDEDERRHAASGANVVQRLAA
jgi:hypothetical protein